MPNRFRRVERRCYNASGLERALKAYEDHFGLASSDFCEAYSNGEDDPRLKRIPRFDRHVWASLYREFDELSGGRLVAQVERELLEIA